MTAGVVIKIDGTEDRIGWDLVLQAFCIAEIYELPGLGHPLNRSIKLETLEDLGNYHPADQIILAPVVGDFVQGDEDLKDLEHPEEAIYIFGGTMTRLTEADVALGIPTAKVYIPADGADLFPSQAGAIVLWDRYTKRGFS